MASFPYDVSDVIIVGDQIMLSTFSGGKTQNIFNLITRIDIYESLNNNTMSADFYIGDGTELINYFPIAGEEFIDIAFQTPNKKIISCRFFVNNVVGQSSKDNAMMKMYCLQCVTEDFLTNSYTLYTKRYPKGYLESVKEVLSDLNATVGLNIQDGTVGKFDYVVNRVRPFQVIDLICERAVSPTYKSSVFTFYQDNEGYNFTTYENLIETRKGKAENFKFVYDTANRAYDYEKVINYRNILKYETCNQGNTIDKVRVGNHRKQVREFDILHGTYFYQDWEYTNTSDYSIYKKTDANIDFNSSMFNATVEKYPGSTIMAVKDGTRPDMKHNENIHWMKPFVDKITQYMIRIRVYGDTDLLVGDVVSVEIPDITGTTVEPKQQEIYSGNYLVMNLKHMLERSYKNDGRFRHMMILELVKPNILKGIG